MSEVSWLPGIIVLAIGLSLGLPTPHVHFDVFRDERWDDISFDIGRRFSLPANFSNADGPLDSRGGLIALATYSVLPIP